MYNMYNGDNYPYRPRWLRAQPSRLTNLEAALRASPGC